MSTFNIEGYCNSTLESFHNEAIRALKFDDDTPEKDKLYGVRVFDSWKTWISQIEAELTKRNLSFTKISW